MGFIQAMRHIKNHAPPVACEGTIVRISTKGKVERQGSARELAKGGQLAKRSRKLNTRYFEVVVQYEGVGEVKLYLCRFPNQKQWRVFLSTDRSLSFLPMMEIYATQWTIEVFFKEMKHHLRLGSCQSRDFDAQITHLPTCGILNTFLAYFRRVNAYESLGARFKGIVAESVEKLSGTTVGLI